MDPRPVPTPGPTPAVDPFAGLAEQLAHVEQRPLAEQVGVFTDVHTRLNAALAATAGGGDASDPRMQPGRPMPGGR